jgi:8-oxo-dGTP pyrophosphatase MutT (NUDIX family)
MQTRKIATSFLQFEGRILILKRSGKVSTYRGKWAAVSGGIEKGEEPLARAQKEIEEETGLEPRAFKIARKGKPFAMEDRRLGVKWIIHPFLFTAKTGRIKIDWEHAEFKWIKPEELAHYETVPKLAESLKRLLSP